MTSFVRIASIVFVLLTLLPSTAQAGMPSFDLTDIGRLRLQTISFFLMGLLLSSWFVQLLWNYLGRDFTFLPRLTYGKALGAVILWGLLFVLVLTMISGARELMTPGAWEKQGLTYRLAPEPTAAPSRMEREQERRASLDRLRIALWDYAQAHEGRFPPNIPSAGFDEKLWRTPGFTSAPYLYVGGLTANRDAFPLVYEPDAYGSRRLVLLTDGRIQTMEFQEILASLPPEGRR
jgi:hypothetical protein